MIECINISKRFKNHKVLSNINLSLSECGLISIVGESGSGKSTLLNIIGGLSDEYSGTVLYNGKDIIKYKHDIELRNKLKEQACSLKAELKYYKNCTLCSQENREAMLRITRKLNLVSSLLEQINDKIKETQLCHLC